MSGYKKSLNKPYLFDTLSNDPSDLFNYTMNNIMDGFYDSAMNTSTDGKFKAVCLSGIRTEDGTGAGTDANDAQKSGVYVSVIVRPLTEFGNIIPDPRKLNDPDQINSNISLHGSMFLARSDYSFKSENPVSFGQIIDCYFENGSIINSDFKTLRFSEPKDKMIERSFERLSFISGVSKLASTDWSSASALGEPRVTETQEGKSTNIKGDRTSKVQYIVVHYSAAFGGKDAVLNYENKNTSYGYHYMIDRDGSYYETAEPNKIVWHAGGNGTIGNRNSVGICLMNVGYEREGVYAKSNWVSGKIPNGTKTLKWEPYTEESLETAATICANILKQYGLQVNSIVGHSDLQKEKQDPGPAFSMIAFQFRVAQKLAALT